MIVPTSDQDIDWLARHHEALAPKFRFSVSYTDGMANELMDKHSLYALCRQAGIETPRSHTARRDEILDLADQVHYPCLVKPTRIDRIKQAMRGRKGFIAESRTELTELSLVLPEGDTDWLVQEIVPGPESAISLCAMFVNQAGETSLAMTCQKLRQFPPGFGSASLVRTTEDDETLNQSMELLSATRYRGIAATEFKRDPRDGKLKLIEINPRPSLWFGITSTAGMPFVLSHYLDLTGANPDQNGRTKRNVEWRYHSRDLTSRFIYLKGSASGLPPPSTKRTGSIDETVSAVFAADDMKPALTDLTQSLKTMFARGITKLSPSSRRSS
ncbi:MAG: hypothetical protein AAGJ32_01325 [Pseudomonadota bacterium]